MTETRTGPLGCSNYDNLDSVSSVLVRSPENKIYLQGATLYKYNTYILYNIVYKTIIKNKTTHVLPSGLQAILPVYLRNQFVQAALSYISCHSEGKFKCRNNDCWCECSVDFPQCNCPTENLKAMQDSLRLIRESWTRANNQFKDSGNIRDYYSLFLITSSPSHSGLQTWV